MSGISLESIIGFVIEDLPKMVIQKDNTAKFGLQIQGEEELTLVKIELEANPLKSTYQDASVVIRK